MIDTMTFNPESHISLRGRREEGKPSRRTRKPHNTQQNSKSEVTEIVAKYPSKILSRPGRSRSEAPGGQPKDDESDRGPEVWVML